MASRPDANPTRDELCKMFLGKAEQLEREEKFKEALETIQEVIKLNPSCSSKVYSTKGALLCKLENFKDSVVAYCTALNLEKNSKDKKSIMFALERPLDKYMALNWTAISTTEGFLVVQCVNSGGKRLNLLQRLHIVGNFMLDIQLLLQDAKAVLEAVLTIASKGESLLYYVYMSLGQVNHQLDDLEKSLHYFKEALSSAKSPLDISACEWVGITCCQLKRYTEGDSFLQKALKGLRNFPLALREENEIRILIKMACALELSGKVDNAIEKYKELLRRSMAAKMVEREVEIRGHLGKAYETAGDWRKACEQHRKTLDLSRRFQLRKYEGSSLNNLVDYLRKLGNYSEAENVAKEHLEFSVKTQSILYEASACSSLGSIYHAQGDYVNAIFYHERDLKITQEQGDTERAGVSLTNIGLAYSCLGDYKRAIEYHKKRLEVARECDDEEGEMIAHTNLSDTYNKLGDFNKANSEYELYEACAMKRNDPETEAEMYVRRGQRLLENDSGDYAEAIRLYQKALSIARSIGSKALESDTLYELGFAHLNCTKRNIQEAMLCFQQGRNISREQGDVAMEARQTNGLASTYLTSGKDVEAESELKKCVNLHENIRQKLIGKESMKIFIQDVQKPSFKRLEFVQIKLKKYEEALLTAERGRARAIADVMQLNSESDQTPKSIEDVRSLAYNFPVLFYSLISELVFIWVIHCDGKISFRQHSFLLQSTEGTSLQKQIEKLCEEMSRKAYASSTLNKLQSTTALGSAAPLASEVYCSAAVGSVQPQTLHNANNPSGGGVVFGRNDPVLPSEGVNYLVERISRMYRRIDKSLCTGQLPPKLHRNETPPSQSGGDDLYNTLIAPVQDLLVDSPEIVIVPEGPLYKLPFSALRDQNWRYLFNSVRIRMVPSLTTLLLIAKRRVSVKCKNVLIAGDPDVGNVQVDGGKIRLVSRLPGANMECEMVGQMLNVTPLTGKKATKTAVLELLGHAHLIHLAAHGHPDTGEIFLSPETHSANSKLRDVMLQMSEVQAVTSRAQLVVLSCCDSGRGEIRTEGVIGIARSFLAAGARAVLVSLWAIDDEGTYQFMHSFYSHLISGMSANEAQHQTMADMRISERFHQEKYWAPFVLLGDDVTLDFDPQLGSKQL